jgi:hypothetical protein
MNVKFKYTAAESVEPVVFEEIFAERPGGGLVANQVYDLKAGTAMGLSGGKYVPIRAYRLTKAVAAQDTTIEIAKGSGIVIGDIIAHDGTGLASTNLNSTDPLKDVVTVTLGIVIPIDTVLYQAANLSVAATPEVVDGTGHTTTVGVPAVTPLPKYTPAYVLGDNVIAAEGDKLVRLVNGANLRKETAPISEEVVALLKNITLV